MTCFMADKPSSWLAQRSIDMQLAPGSMGLPRMSSLCALTALRQGQQDFRSILLPCAVSVALLQNGERLKTCALLEEGSRPVQSWAGGSSFPCQPRSPEECRRLGNQSGSVNRIPCYARRAQIPGQEEPGKPQKDASLLPGLIHSVPFLKDGTVEEGEP